MKNFINWLEERGLLEYCGVAATIVVIILGVILFIAWIIALAIAGIVIAAGVFTVSGWWLLAAIPWLLLVTVTIAAGLWAKDHI